MKTLPFPSAVGATSAAKPLLRHSARDLLLVTGLIAHGAALLLWPSIPLIALLLWWNANTIAHNFIHNPFFTRRWHNALFSAALTLALGLPQRLWRDRHMAHHGECAWRWKWSVQMGAESALVAALWMFLLIVAPVFFFSVYLPGWFVGLGLCHLQGHFEHCRGVVSHYGALYNALFFNDGFHAEHHARPQTHWSSLPALRASEGHASRWPAALRWMERLSLDGLERLLLHSPALQRWMLRKHEAAIAQLIGDWQPSSALVVGGGLFPRSVLILQNLAPSARILAIDENPQHLEIARRHLDDRVTLEQGRFNHDSVWPADLLIGPLAFRGDRGALYDYAHAPRRLVHDWIWRPRGKSAVVSWLLLKRVNLIEGQC